MVLERELPAKKRIADLLTASRLVLAVMVMVLMSTSGRGALETVLVLVLIGWTTDVFDGRLARSLETPSRTWIGDNDLAVDLVLDVAGFIFFIACGFVPVVISLVYLLIACVVCSFKPNRDIITIFEIPVLALHPIIALAKAPFIGIMYVVWLLAAAVYNRERLRSILKEVLDFEGNGNSG